MKKTIKKVAVLALCVVMGTSVCACGSNNNEALYLEKIAQLEQELIDANRETQKQLDKIESLEKDLADANKKIEDAKKAKKAIKINYQKDDYLYNDLINGFDVVGRTVVVVVDCLTKSKLDDTYVIKSTATHWSSLDYQSYELPDVESGDELVLQITGVQRWTDNPKAIAYNMFKINYEILERR